MAMVRNLKQLMNINVRYAWNISANSFLQTTGTNRKAVKESRQSGKIQGNIVTSSFLFAKLYSTNRKRVLLKTIEK